MNLPVIGITVDNRDNTAASGRYESSIAYSRCVAQAGGLPVLLPHEPGLAKRYVLVCDGLVLTGGVDPDTRAFGQPIHPQARVMDPKRQAFELALLAACDHHPDKPVLGVCLGMQLMALRAGGQLHQYLPEVVRDPGAHAGDRRHAIQLCVSGSALTDGPLEEPDATVVSAHRQAVADADGGVWLNGAAGPAACPMRVVATAPDGVVEAIDAPDRRFYVGVQWHPERGGAGVLNQGLFDRLVATARCATSRPSSAQPQP